MFSCKENVFLAANMFSCKDNMFSCKENMSSYSVPIVFLCFPVLSGVLFPTLTCRALAPVQKTKRELNDL